MRCVLRSVVNYEGFAVDDDAAAAYRGAVKYVEERYDVKVSRYTNNTLQAEQLSQRQFGLRFSMNARTPSAASSPSMLRVIALLAAP